jgi:hypothetical protein
MKFSLICKRLMKMQIIVNLFVGVICFILGRLSVNFPGISYFSLDKSVNIVELISILFTGIIAIFITLKLERYVTNKRVEKELYIAKISEIEKLLDDVDDLLKEKNPSYRKISSINAFLRIKKQSIFNNIQNFKPIKKIYREYDTYLADHIKILKPLLTATSKDSGLIVNKDKCEYNNERIIEIQKELTSIKEKLFEFKVKINSI